MSKLTPATVLDTSSADALKEVATQRQHPCKIAKSPQKINNRIPRAGMLATAAGDVNLLFVLHLSRPFSWRKWNALIQGRLWLDGSGWV